MSLSGKQVRFLRGLGHHLKPVVMIGKDEVSEAVISATDEALGIHELIKVKLQEGCLGDRKKRRSGAGKTNQIFSRPDSGPSYSSLSPV